MLAMLAASVGSRGAGSTRFAGRVCYGQILPILLCRGHVQVRFRGIYKLGYVMLWQSLQQTGVPNVSTWDRT